MGNLGLQGPTEEHGTVDQRTFQHQYELFWQGQLEDPFPLFHRLRQDDPVHWSSELDCWVLTRYADVAGTLRHDPRLSVERIAPLIRTLPESMRTEMEPLRQHLFAWMQHQDPPDHTRLRTLVSKAFTPRTVEGMRARNQALVDELIDAVQAQGRMDFSLEFALLLPLITITELLGLPPDDRDDFHRWTLDITRFMEGIGPDFPGVARRAQQIVLEVHEYLGALFEQRRRQPEDDLISGLLAAEEEGDRLTELELYGMCIFLLVAGHHTTKSLLTEGLLALLENPDQLQRLKDDPSLGKSALEELLRYVSPIKFLSRYALRDFELDGRSVRKGQKLWAIVAAANRDPDQFQEPDRLDITRKPNRHVAFGYGIHTCLGAPLVRMQGQIAFETLLRRLPDLRLAGTPRRRSGINRPIESLPVAFDSG